jgi:hypothetical protein
LLDRLFLSDAITLTELSRGRGAILRGHLDELLVPVLDAGIGDHLGARGVLRS